MTFCIKKDPNVEILGTIGDVNPIAYGGGYVCRRTDRPDDLPWVEFCHGVEFASDVEIRESTFEVYREDVHADVCAYLDWADLAKVAESCDTTPEELRECGRSKNVMDRVWAIETIALYYGWNGLDSYPLSLTIAELCERWGDDPADYMPEEDEDEDDGIINPVLDDDYDSDLE